jgi:hypothetical protein
MEEMALAEGEIFVCAAKSRLVNWAGVFWGIALYAPQHRAMTCCLYRPLLDDIPAEGVPFPQTDKEKHDVDYCRAQEGIDG